MQIKCLPVGSLQARITATSFVLICNVVLSARAQTSATDISPTNDTEVSSMITTGSGYDSWTGSSHHEVVDMVIPGAVGEHGLKWTRTYNSMTGGWSVPYTWRYHGKPLLQMDYPDGRTGRFQPGIKDRLINGPTPIGQCNGQPVHVKLEDGSDISMDCVSEDNGEPPHCCVDYITPTQITDRYGRVTTLDWQEIYPTQYKPDLIQLVKVTDPSGRWLQLVYGSVGSSPNEQTLKEVDASNGDWVKYTYGNGLLTHVDYSDGTSADYTYDWATYNSHDLYGNPTVYRFMALVTARDTRADGPMRSIRYEYRSPGNFKGEVAAEYDLDSGAMVTHCDNKISPPDTGGLRMEWRGDNPNAVRYIRMDKFKNNEGQLPMVTYKEDYNRVRESYTYDPGTNYLTAVTDRRGNTTKYTLESVIGNPISMIHPDGTHIDYTYSDPANPYWIHTLKDEDGNVTTYTRDPNTHLITRIDYPDGGYEAFAYNTFGQVTVHQRRNGAYEYAQYDSTGLLLKFWNPTTKPPSVSVTDNDPHTTFIYYPTGHVWQDRVQTVIDPLGHVTSYEYDLNSSRSPVHGRGLVTKITNPDNSTKTFTYDQFGNKVSETDELGHTTTHTYDSYKRLLTTTDPLGNVTTLNYTATNGASPYTHTTNSVRFHTSPTGIVTGQTFDNNFRLAAKVEASGTSLAATTLYGYDPNGNQTSVTDPRTYVTTFSYDSRNRKTSSTNPLNQTTSWAYDLASNVLTITRPDNTKETKTYDAMHRVLTDTDPLNRTTTFRYNPSGTVHTLTDANGHVTTFSYDAADLKTQMLYQNSDHQDFVYDANHNLTSRRTTSGVYQVFTYDNRNRKTSMGWHNSTDPNSTDISWANWVNKSTFGYDVASRLILANNGASAVSRQYDNANRLTHDTQALTGSSSFDVQYTYNGDGKVTHVSIPSTYDLGIGYDAMGRLGALSNASLGSIAGYIYDASSNITERDTLPNKSKIVYTRDALNRISRRDVNLSAGNISSESYGFDAMSRLTSVSRTEDNLQDRFGYSTAGEMTLAQYGLVNSTPTPPPSAGQDAATYVAQSVPSTMTPGGSYNVSVTMKNSGTSTWTSANNYRLGSQNPQDNTTWGGRVALPSPVAPGAQVTFNFTVTAPSTAGTYNFQWRMVHDGVAWFGDYTPNVAVTDGSPPPTPTPTPDPGGGGGGGPPCVPRCPVPPTITTAGTYPAPMAVSMSSDIGGATIFYTQSDSGYEVPTHDGATPTGSTVIYTAPIVVDPGTIGYFVVVVYVDGVGDSNLTQFAADNTGSALLSSAGATATSSTAQRTVNYTLDNVGNRTQVVDGGATKNYTPDNINRYTQVGSDAVASGPAHQIGSYQSNSYQYVGDTYLASITQGSNTYILAYDALGRCVKRILNGASTYYVYDGDKAILERGSVSATTVYGVGIDEVVMRTDNTASPARTYYFYEDHEGSITHVANGTTLAEQYRYDAFGAPTIKNAGGVGITTSAIGNRFMFTGREYDSTFGIYEYRARAYHPTLGRFMSEDPKGFDAGDYNLFRYCHNDPEDLTDPMGLVEIPPYIPSRLPPPPPPPHNPFSGTSKTGYSIDKWGPPPTGRGLTLAQTGQTVQNKNGREHFSSESDAATKVGDRAYSLQQGIEPHREYNSSVSQNKQNPNDYVASPPVRGDLGSVKKDKYGHEGYKNYSDITRDPSPSGYKRVAIVYTHINWRDNIDPEDRRAFAAHHLNAYLVTPPRAGSNITSPNFISFHW